MAGLPDNKTAEELGFKVGDKFRIIGTNTPFRIGTIVTLHDDDLTSYPYFTDEDGEEDCVHFRDLEPYEVGTTTSVDALVGREFTVGFPCGYANERAVVTKVTYGRICYRLVNDPTCDHGRSIVETWLKRDKQPQAVYASDFGNDSITNLNKESNNMEQSAKYYRVTKDTTLLSEGAILKCLGSECESINDLWNTEAGDAVVKATGYQNVRVRTVEVEAAKDHYERVYEVSLLGKAKFAVKQKAIELHDAMFKAKK